MRRNRIPLARVQEAFNAAVRRRDGRCMVRDYEPCDGQLEASHFYTVGSCPSLRFYPPNCYAQCSKHHWKHHNDKEWTTYYGAYLGVYKKWLNMNHFENFLAMQPMRNRYIKYTDELKAEIVRLCNADRLDGLTELIEKELGK